MNPRQMHALRHPLEGAIRKDLIHYRQLGDGCYLTTILAVDR